MATAKEPNFGETETTETAAPEGYISREDLERILSERDRRHQEELSAVRARVPVAMVPQHSGGPGVDQHQVSWNLAEQEAAMRGETLDHWITRD